MAEVRFVGVTKRYGGSDETAVENLHLSIADGEFFVLLGPSGCGKSTLLKIIAGLEEPTEGEIYIGSELVNYREPGRRNVAMVFQEYALYPHMTVRKNIAFPLRMRKTKRAEIEEAVTSAARTLELEALLERSIEQLSGGQRQRVALARAIVRRPTVMLLDEPLSNLDAVLRLQTRDELLRLHRSIRTTMVYVTHDQVEAMTMGHRIAVMNRGSVVQIGTPREVYNTPANVFVAGFIGSPPMNLVPGRIIATPGGGGFRGQGAEVELPEHLSTAIAAKPNRENVTLGVRPNAVRLTTVKDVNPPAGAWVVEIVEELGSERLVGLRLGDERIRASLNPLTEIAEGDCVAVAFDASQVHLFDEAGENILQKPSGGAAYAVAGSIPESQTVGAA